VRVVEIVVEVTSVENEVEVVVDVIEKVVVAVGLNVVLVKREGVVMDASPIVPAAGVERKPNRDATTRTTTARFLLNNLNLQTS
jgi:hypothetical protein